MHFNPAGDDDGPLFSAARAFRAKPLDKASDMMYHDDIELISIKPMKKEYEEKMENREAALRNVPEEKELRHRDGMASLMILLIGLAASIACIVRGSIRLAGGVSPDRVLLPMSNGLAGGLLLTVGIVGTIAFCIAFAGLKVLAPNQAYVFTFFGQYAGTLKKPGFFFVNPFVTANAPVSDRTAPALAMKEAASGSGVSVTLGEGQRKKISLRTRTLNNNKQKVNDALGNPIIIGSVVIWHVADPTAAVFAVENFEEYLSIQCDSTIRNIARLYPYDTMEEVSDEKTLRGSSSEISEIMQSELSERVKGAGLVIEDVRITTLAYAEEIAAAMLQRQQATAIIAARQKIVEGAVGMVKMAIDQLGEEEVVVLDEERKAAMVSNLLVVLCGNKDAQPIVNSGSIY